MNRIIYNPALLFTSLQKKKAPGGALYFAIFISLLITLLTGFFILRSFYTRTYIENLQKQERIKDNVHSGLVLLLNEFSSLSKRENVIVDLFNEEEDNVSLSISHWGAYYICCSQAGDETCSFSRRAIIGAEMEPEDQVGLYLADRGRYLSISGKTYITGETFLPALGIRKAYIEGQVFAREQMVQGNIHVSQSQLPPLPNSLIESNFPYLRGHCRENDSILDFRKANLPDTITNSFTKPTMVLFSKDDIILDKITVSGNIRIISNKSILVTSNAKIENSILYAANIFLAPAFSGSLQAFARDTILVGTGCSLYYPSVTAIIDTAGNDKLLHFMTGSKLEGCVFFHAPEPFVRKGFLYVDKEAKITGQVWWPGPVQHQGKMTGSLFCNSFFLRTASACYDDHLLNAVIDGKTRSLHYLGIGIRNADPRYKVISWVE